MMEEGKIIDAENYRGIDGSVGFKEICMRQLQRVVTNFSQEMRAGFWIYSQKHPQMNPEKLKYVGDSRKELRQSIDVLHDLLMPKFDKEMKEESEKLYKEFEDLYGKNKEEKTQKSEYWYELLRIYRKLFQQLCLFLERLGWLEGTEVEE